MNKSVHIQICWISTGKFKQFPFVSTCCPSGKWIFYCNCEKQDELCHSVPKLKRGTEYVVFHNNPVPSLVFVAQQPKSCTKEILLERHYIKAFYSTGFIPCEWWWWSPEKSCCLGRNLVLHTSLVCSRNSVQISSLHFIISAAGEKIPVMTFIDISWDSRICCSLVRLMDRH